MKKILFAFSLFVLTQPAFAKWYQVEMVVFEHLTADTGGELWSDGEPPNYLRAIKLRDQDDESPAFKKMPSSSYKLGGVNKVFKLSSEYRPLYHVAWQQPELTKSRAKKVHIKKPEAKINGTVNLRGGHLLHLDIDMTYFIDLVTEELSTFSEDSEFLDTENIEVIMSGTHTQLKETRRIKLNELHYFDHPLFGIVMRVTRLALEE